MALKGNLRDFTFVQLLNLINLARKSGTLVIEGASEKAYISFRDGKLAYAQLGEVPTNLATILYRANRINAAQHSTLKTRMGQMSDKELGLLLINANYLSQAEILKSVQEHFVSIVQSLFTWVEGLFYFDSDRLPPDDRITVRMPLENIIIDGTRRLREWEQLQDEIPSLDMVLKFKDDAKDNLRNVNLSVEEWRVVRFINAKNTIHQIALATKMNDLEIRRIVYSLIQAGLIEMIRPEAEIKFLGERPGMSPVAKEEQKSLVNRIIGRIRSL